MDPTRRPRVIIADDNIDILNAVSSVLSDEFEIVRAVGDGRSLVDGVEELHPDIGIVDISMPVMNGLKAAAEIARKHLPFKLIFLTVHENPDLVRAAFACGASAFVNKRQMMSDLPLAIEAAIAGDRFISAGYKV